MKFISLAQKCLQTIVGPPLLYDLDAKGESPEFFINPRQIIK